MEKFEKFNDCFSLLNKTIVRVFCLVYNGPITNCVLHSSTRSSTYTLLSDLQTKLKPKNQISKQVKIN